MHILIHTVHIKLALSSTILDRYDRSSLNEDLQGQVSACWKRTYISAINITYGEIQASSYENQPVEKGR